MGLKSTRPLPLAHAELAMAPFFKRRFRSWHLDHVELALERYRLLTPRFCLDALQLSAVLGIKEKALVQSIMQLFLPRTPTRVQCMVDAMEVLIALALVCQAPSMLRRFEVIFDIVDMESNGFLSSTDFVLLCGAVGRAIMKLFEYDVEPEQQAVMEYITSVIDSEVVADGKIAKEILCKFMLSDLFAVHYVKQCTGQDKPKLYVMMEKDTEFLGAVEFSNEQQMRSTSLRTVRDMIYAQVQRVPQDFTFLSQGREVEKVWEVDRRAWSTVPFALRGSPGLRTDIHAKNRKLERPAAVNQFEFRYMGNTITRYKKFVHEISPVYKHRDFRLRNNSSQKGLVPVGQWRVATTWSGEWLYNQQRVKTKTKPEILKHLRGAARPKPGVLLVKDHSGEIVSSCYASNSKEVETMQGSSRLPSANPSDPIPTISPKTKKRMQRIEALTMKERRLEKSRRSQRIQWKARVIAMEAHQQMDERDHDRIKKEPARRGHRSDILDGAGAQSPNFKTVLVHVEEDIVLPSRLVPTKPKKRRRPKKLKYATRDWAIPDRLLAAAPPRSKKLKVSVISNEIALTTPSETSQDGQISLGQYLSSTNVILDDNQIEVFPVLVIRPLEEQVLVCSPAGFRGVEDLSLPSPGKGNQKGTLIVRDAAKEPLLASKSYLTEFEYEISTTESNYEMLYQHISSNMLQDALWLNRRDVFGRTMLHDTAEFGHPNVMELLLKARVVVDSVDRRGDTPLHHAARHGRLKEVSMLLREHAVPTRLNYEGKSPLYSALETAAREMHGANCVTTEGTDMRKNFFFAHRAYPQLRQVIDLLWDRYELAYLEKMDVYDRTCCLELEKEVYGDMIGACREGNLIRVQRLVDLEKRSVAQYLNEQMEFLQRTALHEATERGHTALVDLLLKLGANGYLRDQRLQTPFHIAAEKGHLCIVQCLLAKFPGTASFQDISGKTALHLAVQSRHWDIACELIAVMKGGYSAGSRESVPENCDSSPAVKNLDLQDVHGYTALHYACIHGNEEVCTALLRADANPSISRQEYVIPKGSSQLFGMYWKGETSRGQRRRGIATKFDQCTVFDIMSPLELLLRACKFSSTSYSERLRILELLLGLHRRLTTNGEQALERKLVKTSPPALFHIAGEVADVNMSVAVGICRHLYKLQFEINAPHHRTGETALLQECKHVCYRASKLASLGTGSDGDQTDRLALVRSLLEMGANADLSNELNGESPLGCAAWNGNLALMDLLLESGADKDGFLRRCSFSPLHFAALGGNVICTKLLIGRKAKINVEMPPQNPEMPLYFAIRSKSEAMVGLLLHSGADATSLCTVQQNVTTSFHVSLSLPNLKGGRSGKQIWQMFSPEREHTDSAALVVPPLTFALLIAQSCSPFGRPEEMNCTVMRAQKYAEWATMNRICVMIARRFFEENDGSKGMITRSDVYLASRLGYWDLVQMLLSYQITLSNSSSSLSMNALHFAAAAGQTNVVTALVAGGMNVNCVTPHGIQRRQVESDESHVIWGNVYGRTGSLYFALINGHAETATKLLVLGASPEKTIPHIKAKIRWRKPYIGRGAVEFSTYHAVRFLLSEAMRKEDRTAYIADKSTHRSVGYTLHEDKPAVNLIHYIESSVNQKVPLLHLVVALGHVKLVRILVDVGMNIFAGFSATEDGQTSISGHNGEPETAVHVAVSCGHLEILKMFAVIAQHHFPQCFSRKGDTVKSLLLTACVAHQTEILRFLLNLPNDNDSKEICGGGYTYTERKDEFQRALRTCAAVQFVQGFHLLVACGAKPDVHTLVGALHSVAVPVKGRPSTSDWEAEPSFEGDSGVTLVAFPEERYRHDPGTSSIETCKMLVDAIVPADPLVDVCDFLGTSPIFDVVVKILIICSRHKLWFVLNRIFVHHLEQFEGATSIWKPVIVRAACCCLVLHRAAMHNQTQLVAFFLRLGVPPDLRLSEIPSVRSPIWYAASRGCLEAFLWLALSSPQFVNDLAIRKDLNSLEMFFRSIHESRSYLVNTKTTCRWQNVSVFGCIGLPKAHTNCFLIQKFINYGILEQRESAGDSLLHRASCKGELLAVQALIEAGADITAKNALAETPLEVASGRKDSFGLPVVKYLLSALPSPDCHGSANIIDRALVCCFAQPPPTNLKIAKALLVAGANASYTYDGAEKKDKTGGSAHISALYYALQSAQLAGVNLLLEYGASLTVALSEVFLTPLLMGAKHQTRLHWRRFSRFLKGKDRHKLLLDVEGVMKLLLRTENFSRVMNVDLVQQILVSASAIAATIAKQVGVAQGFWSVVTSILEKYPSEGSSRRAEWNQRTALHYAVASSEATMVTKLLELRGFDLLAEDERKQTPLHLVGISGDEAICRLLLGKLRTNKPKATAIDVPDERGRTALHLAVIYGHDVVVDMLVSAGASSEARCQQGFTAMLYAAKCNRLAILISLHSRAGPSARESLRLANGEAGVFLAARFRAFPVVKWFINLHIDGGGDILGDGSTSLVNNKVSLLEMKCRFQRTVLHYAAMYGDEDTLKLVLQGTTKVSEVDVVSEAATRKSIIDARDADGYTPLLYAFAFGRLGASGLLCLFGADFDVGVDHSADPNAHPYAVGFDIGALLQLFALPGWYSFVCKFLPAQDKARLVQSSSIDEDYLQNSSYSYQKVSGHPPMDCRLPVFAANGKGKPQKMLVPSRNERGKERVRMCMRTWRFPQKSLFDFACEIGDAQTAKYLVSTPLPHLFRGTTYRTQRRNFMQAVRWNRLEVVKALVESATSANAAVSSTAKNHFMDFLEIGIECSVSRGLEDMAIFLLTQWHGIKENGRKGATPSAFAFQFAPAFQVACIRRMTNLIGYMIERGGEDLVDFHWNEGSALAYAFAFGHVDVIDLLLRHGAHPNSPTEEYVAASVLKWTECGCPKSVRVPWYRQSLPKVSAALALATQRPTLVGPLEAYEPPTQRLPIELICEAFANVSIDANGCVVVGCAPRLAELEPASADKGDDKGIPETSKVDEHYEAVSSLQLVSCSDNNAEQSDSSNGECDDCGAGANASDAAPTASSDTEANSDNEAEGTAPSIVATAISSGGTADDSPFVALRSFHVESPSIAQGQQGPSEDQTRLAVAEVIFAIVSAIQDADCNTTKDARDPTLGDDGDGPAFPLSTSAGAQDDVDVHGNEPGKEGHVQATNACVTHASATDIEASERDMTNNTADCATSHDEGVAVPALSSIVGTCDEADPQEGEPQKKVVTRAIAALVVDALVRAIETEASEDCQTKNTKDLVHGDDEDEAPSARSNNMDTCDEVETHAAATEVAAGLAEVGDGYNKLRDATASTEITLADDDDTRLQDENNNREVELRGPEASQSGT